MLHRGVPREFLGLEPVLGILLRGSPFPPFNLLRDEGIKFYSLFLEQMCFGVLNFSDFRKSDLGHICLLGQHPVIQPTNICAVRCIHMHPKS